MTQACLSPTDIYASSTTLLHHNTSLVILVPQLATPSFDVQIRKPAIDSYEDQTMNSPLLEQHLHRAPDVDTSPHSSCAQPKPISTLPYLHNSDAHLDLVNTIFITTSIYFLFMCMMWIVTWSHWSISPKPPCEMAFGLYQLIMAKNLFTKCELS